MVIAIRRIAFLSIDIMIHVALKEFQGDDGSVPGHENDLMKLLGLQMAGRKKTL